MKWGTTQKAWTHSQRHFTQLAVAIPTTEFFFSETTLVIRPGRNGWGSWLKFFPPVPSHGSFRWVSPPGGVYLCSCGKCLRSSWQHFQEHRRVHEESHSGILTRSEYSTISKLCHGTSFSQMVERSYPTLWTIRRFGLQSPAIGSEASERPRILGGSDQK